MILGIVFLMMVNRLVRVLSVVVEIVGGDRVSLVLGMGVSRIVGNFISSGCFL